MLLPKKKYFSTKQEGKAKWEGNGDLFLLIGIQRANHRFY